MYFRLALRAKTQPIGNYRGKTTARISLIRKWIVAVL
jgi:hypothetical protein